MSLTLAALQGWMLQWVDITWVNGLVANNPFLQPKNERGTHPRATETERHALNLAPYLAEARPGDTFDRSRFWDSGVKTEETLLRSNIIPYGLWAWKTSSSRVFHLDSNLQTLLLVTGFTGDIGIEDLQLPFDSFVIELSNPLTIVEGNSEAESCLCRHLLFYRLPATISGLSRDFYCLHVIGENFSTYQPLSAFHRNQLLIAVRQRSLHKAQKVLIPRYQGYEPLKEHFLLFTLEGLQNFLQQEEELQRQKPLAALAFRLMIGLPLYLQTLPLQSSHRSVWKKAPFEGRKEIKPVFKEVEVCNITTEAWLSPAAQTELRANNYVPCGGWATIPHFRRGHMRRRPGEGHDPVAPRIIRVNPAFVRGDLMPEGQPLPGGKTKLT
jgi:hypothetical protein